MNENLASFSNWASVIAAISVMSKFVVGAMIFWAGQLFERTRK